MTNKTGKGILVFLITVSIGLCVAYFGGQNGTQYGSTSVFLICGLWAFAVNWLGFIPANIYQTEKYYDLIGAFTNTTIVLLAAALSGPLSTRAIIVTAMVTIWAIRLGSFLFKRISKDGGDSRFDKIKPNFIRFLNAWTIQALWVVLTTACAVAIITSGNDKPLGIIAYIGIAVWLIGFSIEVISDRQKTTFRSDPANKGKFITTGLWAWSRHPNYFGEIVLWTGIAIIALPILSGGQWVTLISPVFVFLLLTRVSGIPMLEAKSDQKWGGSEGYESYKNRTPPLMMRPPAKT